MTNNTSWTNLALTQEEAFSRNVEDTSLAKIGKFAVAKTITTGSFAFAIIETTLSAVAQVFLAPLYLVSPKSYSVLTQHRKDSFQTAVSAALHTFGFPDSPKSLDKSRLQRFKDSFEASIEVLSKKAIETLDFGKDHKKAIAALALSTIAATAYFFLPQHLSTEFNESAQKISSQTYESDASLKNWIFELFSPINSMDPPPNNSIELPESQAIRDQEHDVPLYLVIGALLVGVTGFIPNK